MTATETGTPTYPMSRDPRCPFAPPPEYERLRREEPVTRVQLYDGRTALMFTRYEDIRDVLAHPAVSAETLREDFPFLNPGDRVAKRAQSFQRWDDPRHSDRRRMLMPYFTIKRIEAMRPRVREMISNLLDAMIEHGPPMDLVEHLALALPSGVACELLGVPYSDHEFFESRFAVRMDRTASAAAVRAASDEILDYLDRVVGTKIGANAPDLLGQFVTEQVETGEVSRRDAVVDANLLLLGGHETTANMIAMGTLALLQHPDQLELIRTDKGRVANAVEELLRYLTISQTMGVRVAKEDFEVAGRLVRAGEGLIVPVAAGNWDDAVFAEPDRLDVERQARRHLTFGFGPHVCLGQPLARMELHEVFSTLFDRLPELRLAIPFDDVDFKWDSVFYGVHTLPVEWDNEQAKAVR